MEQKHQPYYHCNRTTGNTTIHDLFEEGCSRQMCWDEENRLAGFSGCHNAGFYQYDAGGERTCKLTWSGSWSSINGTGAVYYLPEGATLYASPYLVITPQGYTKHYYAESERITSQLGKGQFADVGTPVVGDSLVQVKLQEVTGNVEPPATLTAPATPYFSYLDTLTNQQNATSTLYFYHPDHLGSSSWITTTNGTVKQHLHYLPWGEDFVNQRSSHFDGVRYTFSAKEKDTETGYSYFGAQYYSSDLSVWLSVDPKAEKYPSLSSYAYCANNPLKYIDPNGEAITPETAWDIINVVMGAASFTGNVVSGNILGAAVDAIGLLYDGVATAIPFLPGGASGCVGLVRFVKVTKNLYNSIGKIKNLTCFKKNEKLLSLANKAQNALTENLKIDDIAGAVQDILGIPVKKGGSATYDHLQEVTNSLTSLTNYKRELQSVLNKSNNLSEQEIKVINASIRETNAHITRVEKILKKAKEVKEL